MCEFWKNLHVITILTSVDDFISVEWAFLLFGIWNLNSDICNAYLFFDRQNFLITIWARKYKIWHRHNFFITYIVSWKWWLYRFTYLHHQYLEKREAISKTMNLFKNKCYCLENFVGIIYVHSYILSLSISNNSHHSSVFCSSSSSI